MSLQSFIDRIVPEVNKYGRWNVLENKKEGFHFPVTIITTTGILIIWFLMMVYTGQSWPNTVVLDLNYLMLVLHVTHIIQFAMMGAFIELVFGWRWLLAFIGAGILSWGVGWFLTDQPFILSAEPLAKVCQGGFFAFFVYFWDYLYSKTPRAKLVMSILLVVTVLLLVVTWSKPYYITGLVTIVVGFVVGIKALLGLPSRPRS